MGFTSQGTQQKVPFSYEAVFDAVVVAIRKIGFTLKSQDRVIGRITASTGMSLFSWGENLTIVVEKVDDESTQVAIESALKVGINLTGAHRHQANFNKLISAVSSHLQEGSRDGGEDLPPLQGVGAPTTKPTGAKWMLVAVVALGIGMAMFAVPYSSPSPSPAKTPEQRPAAPSKLTAAQRNARRSANSYLALSGFSRQGLIDQLSSEYGGKFSLGNATVAVDDLGVNWNTQASRAAASYLELSGFSCRGLIDQLSSPYGGKYTVGQATYGATHAGIC